MKKLSLKAEKREAIGKKCNQLRKNGFIPAVIYGHGMETFAISVLEKEFASIIGSSAGKNAIINLTIGSDIFPVLTQDYQKHLISNKFLHVDFFRLKMDEKIKTKVHVELKGLPAGVKDDGGILVQMLREIEIKCLPDSIPEKIELDVSALKIGEGLQVSDITHVKDIEFVTSGNELVAQVSAPTKEEVVAPPVEAAAVAAEGGAAPAAGEAVPPAEADKSAKDAKPAKEAKK